MSNQTNWLDRGIDLLRSRSLLFLLLGLAMGWLLFAETPSDEHLHLKIINHDEIMIDSIQLDFGYNHNQSSLLTLQLPPGQSRLLVLNHPPGRGFNVAVRYADGQQQEFCANRGNPASRQHLSLQR